MRKQNFKQKYKIIDEVNRKEFLTDNFVDEFKSNFTDLIDRHNALLKKTVNIKKEIIEELLDVTLLYFKTKKIKIRKNQLGIGMNDFGVIEVRVHINKKSSIDYLLLEMDYGKNIRVYRINDKLNLIDSLLELFEKIFKK